HFPTRRSSDLAGRQGHQEVKVIRWGSLEQDLLARRLAHRPAVAGDLDGLPARQGRDVLDDIALKIGRIERVGLARTEREAGHAVDQGVVVRAETVLRRSRDVEPALLRRECLVGSHGDSLAVMANPRGRGYLSPPVGQPGRCTVNWWQSAGQSCQTSMSKLIRCSFVSTS